jgi:hypothetical protein
MPIPRPKITVYTARAEMELTALPNEPQHEHVAVMHALPMQ